MTVEAALALCSLMVVLALAIGAVASVGAQLRCTDAAREATRLIVRGEPERARQAAAVIAPAGARVEVEMRGDEVTTTVSARVAGRLGGLVISGRAVGVLEPGVLAVAGPPGASGEGGGDGPAAGGGGDAPAGGGDGGPEAGGGE